MVLGVVLDVLSKSADVPDESANCGTEPDGVRSNSQQLVREVHPLEAYTTEDWE
jgi:hypothetical protein